MAEYSSKINILQVLTSVSKNNCFRIYTKSSQQHWLRTFAEENHSKSIQLTSLNASEFTFGSRIIHGFQKSEGSTYVKSTRILSDFLQVTKIDYIAEVSLRRRYDYLSHLKELDPNL